MNSDRGLPAGAIRVDVRFDLRRRPDLERLVTVGSDLEFLRSLPSDRLLTHTEVRISAGVLRRLLLDNELQKLMRCAEPRPTLTVSAIDIDPLLSAWDPELLKYVFAGGTRAELASHRGLLYSEVPNEACTLRLG